MQSEDRQRLRRIARTDSLTGLANRLAFDEHLAASLRECADRGEPLALAFLDVDFFKTYNDVYGHVAGDECLRTVARVLRECVRPERDLLARYGGEEFALVSRGTSETDAIAHVAAMLDRIASVAIAHAGSSLGRLSLSAGIRGRVPTVADTASDLLRDADRALYRAKMLGRNRVAGAHFVSNGPVVTKQRLGLAAPAPFTDGTFGREAELARIGAALRNERMVTLAGPPGIGKSRLARSIGQQPPLALADGVAYVDLAAADAATDPLALIATALDAGIESNALVEAIVEALRDRAMLLILDEAASPDHRVERLCDRVLGVAPELSILATARHPLGCADERVIVVPPLADDASLAMLHDRTGLGAAHDHDLRQIVTAAAGLPSALETLARHVSVHGLEATVRRVVAHPPEPLVTI